MEDQLKWHYIRTTLTDIMPSNNIKARENENLDHILQMMVFLSERFNKPTSRIYKL